MLYSHGTTASRGVCILIKPKFFCNIRKYTKDINGRFLLCEIETEDKNIYTICNIYAPNKDSPAFFDALHQNLMDYNPNIIMGGDFNLVLECERDRYKSHHNNMQACKVLKTMCTDLKLQETWRIRNPDTEFYSWKRESQASRIDYFLMNDSTATRCDNVMYICGVLTDHSAIFASITDVNSERGPGYWKLNASLLHNCDALKEIKAGIKKAVEVSKHMQPIERWEKVKKTASNLLKNLSRKEADLKALIISQLSEAVTQYEESFPLNEQDSYIYEETKMELETRLLDKTRSAIFRSKAKWYEEGGKCTKYFLSLERARSCARTCHAILKENGVLVEKPEEVLKEQRDFYQKLYAKDISINFNMVNNTAIKIKDEDNLKLNGTIQPYEIFDAIKSMKKGRTPGPDGLPVEFYQVMWPEIKNVLYDSYLQSYQEMSMNPTALEGILNLIPKKNRDTRLLKNLRPITLLNVDYKIVEKVIANRIKSVLPQIIHEDQTGFMSGRRISVNIRKTFDLLRYTEMKNTPHLLHSLDFLKAFDRAEVLSVLKSLEFFNFPEYIIQWIDTLYRNFSVRVQNNGYFSENIAVERSIHQGGCASAFLFNILAETMAIHLRSTLEKYAIRTAHSSHLLSQYADDTGAFTEGTQEAVNELYQQIEFFQGQSGLLINYDKTSIYRLGSLKNSQAKLYTTRKIA